MAIEVPTKDYLKTKCAFCGYGCYIIYKKMPNRDPLCEMQEIVICERKPKNVTLLHSLISHQLTTRKQIHKILSIISYPPIVRKMSEARNEL